MVPVGTADLFLSPITQLMRAPDITPIRAIRSCLIRGTLLLAVAIAAISARNGFTRPALHVSVPDSIRGVYANARVTSTPAAFSAFVHAIRGTTINTIVIDAKDDRGVVYQSNLRLARALTRHTHVVRLDSLIATAHSRGLYVIVRIVTFKDPVLSRHNLAWSLQTPAGKPWRDRSGTTWVDPWNREVWRYNIDIAEEVSRFGADAIQFDYVRFPEPFRNLPRQVSQASRGSRAEAIQQFLTMAGVRLKGLQVQVAADVFGYVMHAHGDLGIGQQWESLLAVADQVSPMIYPSHYSAPRGGPHPNRCPYAATRHTVSLGIGRAKLARSPTRQTARIVPWLQAFQAPWIDRQFRYGPRAVSAQIQAVRDAGLRDWILWNASSDYDPFLPALGRGGAAFRGADVAGCSAAFRWEASPRSTHRLPGRPRSASPFDA